MKKSLAYTLIAVLLVFAACKKNASSVGSWAYGGTKYTATGTTLSTTLAGQPYLTATTSSTTATGELSFYFATQPVTTGNYKVVNYAATLDSGQLYIQFVNAGNFYYLSTGNDNITASVNVSGGKISVTVPPVYLEDYANPVPDSAQLSATIHQQ
jgi:hypothetical protein